MTAMKQRFNKYLKNKRGQVFLVCTVIIIIYMLSFITIVYELNLTQFSKNTEIKDFQSSYENFKTETSNFMKSMLANYSQITTIIDSNATAGQLLEDWLNFAEQQMFAKGYFAVFEINEIIPITTPIELVKGNGFLSITANIDVYLECNYLSIDVELQNYFRYELSYTNTATTAEINFYYVTLLNTIYMGYSQVTVNSLATLNLNNGTYIYSSPLVATDVVEGITSDQIIVTLVV
ncbi:MAG: hypothetical protein ACFFDW_07170 [Candidatus Thorarchaeota archaeon]